ncbi:MAG: hypothetical protein CM15mP125_3170 [Gammaproteobacteria bacterium]|nr:MAG: hypothetical protein CM15mP125_3170 [Gammaproteobacteria bacterium]
MLLDGDCLRSEDGRTVIIRAAPEPLVEATTDNSLIFAKTCYHLGNRHTPIEITELIVRFQPDHVLANMCSDWGLTVKNVERPFYPEVELMGNTPSIVMDTDRAILGALHLFSPSLPIGAFAFSQGLEAAIESGHVAGAVALETWCDNVLRDSLQTLDCHYLRRPIKLRL